MTPRSQSSRTLPLSHLRVAMYGISPVGTLTSHLLSTQGAQVQILDDKEIIELIDKVDGRASPDVVIDATLRSTTDCAQEPGDSLAKAMRDEGRGGIFVKFSRFPPDFPVEAHAVNESLMDGSIGLELLSDEQLTLGKLPVTAAYSAALAVIQIVLSATSDCPFTYIEVPLATSVFTLLGRTLVTPDDPEVRDEMSGPRFPVADIYQCGDGRFIQSHGTTTRFSDGLCDALGHPEWKEAARAGMASLGDVDAVEAWRVLIGEALGQMPALEAQEKIVRSGGSATVCLTRDEWLNSAQARDSEIFSTVENESTVDPALAPHLGPGVVIREDASSLWHDDGQLTNETVDRARPLSGIRVLDLCIVLAGPTSGRVLAEWGADVVKVDSPTRPVSPLSWIDVNRSKRSALIDLTTPQGRDVLRDLIRGADVILENFRSGKLAALGFDYETVSKLSPGIIYASMNAFDVGGPMERHPGWEHNAEAVSGMQTARSIGGVPQQVPYPVNDYLTGLLGAYGILLALLHRDRTGRGARVNGSLARSASFTQLAHFTANAGGFSDLRPAKLVHCRDGAVLVDGHASVDIAVLREKATRLSHEEALALLRAADVACVAAVDVPNLFRAGSLDEHTLTWSQSSAGRLRQAFTRHYGDYRGFGLPRFAAPDPGADTMSELRRLGYDDARLEELIGSGAIAGRQPLFTRR